MIRIDYKGPPRGAIKLASELGKAGIEATFDAPMEQRGGPIQESAVHVAYFIGDHVAGGAISGAAGLAVKAVVDKFKRDHPGVEADVTDDE